MQETVKDCEYDPQLKTHKYIYRTYKVPEYKPVVSYWKSGDPNKNLGLLESRISEITIIRCKHITPQFKNIILKNKEKIFLHLVISGLNSSVMEPNIPTVRDVFYQLKDLLDSGFPIRQVLVIIDPVIQNENGLKMLKLILRIFTEFKEIRLRKIRISLLFYKQDDKGKFIVSNDFIKKRATTNLIMPYIHKSPYFIQEYYKLLREYSAIINVDDCTEALIGVRELNALGYKNEYMDKDGNKRRIIEYLDAAKKTKPDVKIISGKLTRCLNKCLLCPYFG